MKEKSDNCPPPPQWTHPIALWEVQARRTMSGNPNDLASRRDRFSFSGK